MTEAAASCQRCGLPAPDSTTELLAWSLDRTSDQVRWTCPACLTANIRALEAKLEPEWW